MFTENGNKSCNKEIKNYINGSVAVDIVCGNTKKLDVNLDTKSVKIKLNGNNISREIIENIVEHSIVKGKVDGFSMFH